MKVPIRWEEPPANALTTSPAQRKRSALAMFLDALRTRPGQSAVYPQVRTANGAQGVERAAKKIGAEGYEFLFVYDDVDPDELRDIRSYGGMVSPASRGRLFVRFVGVEVHGAGDGLVADEP